MSTLMAAMATLMLSFAGFACLALAMDRHYEQVSGREFTTLRLRRALRGLASALLVAGLIACLQAWGAAVASLVWLGMLSCGALMVALTLSYAAGRLIVLSGAAATAGLTVCVAAWTSGAL